MTKISTRNNSTPPKTKTNQNQINQKITELIGRRISMLRSHQGMNKTELASKIGVSFQQIIKYETGHNKVSADRLISIAKALNVKMINFFPTFIVGEDVGDLLSPRSAREIKILSKVAKLQKLSVEELVLRFLDLLLR